MMDTPALLYSEFQHPEWYSDEDDLIIVPADYGGFVNKAGKFVDVEGRVVFFEKANTLIIVFERWD